MPELPEVEIMTRNAARWLGGRTIGELVICDPRVVSEGGELVAELSGQPFEAAQRRAKHLVATCGEFELAVHFRMTGKLVRGPRAGKVRWYIVTHDGVRVDFEDPRCLGELRVLRRGGAAAWLASLNLGPEPYPGRHDGAWWSERLAGARGAVKPSLMDQKRVAGIGNILASEVCWRAQLNPFRLVPELGAGDFERLARHVPELIGEVVEAESGDEIAYVGESRDAGTTVFSVYAREGCPCPRCRGKIQRAKQAGRSTFYCPECQP